MTYTYLVMTIKSLIQAVILNCGIAIHSLGASLLWVRRKLSRTVMVAGNWSCRAWLIDPQVMNLMLDVASKGNIPLKNVTGFSKSNGAWYVRLKDIGWLRTADILQMEIEIYPPIKEAK